MTLLAVSLQIVGASILIAAAGFGLNVWAAIAVFGLFLFVFGDALERL